MKSKVLCLLLGSIALPLVAQVPATPFITEPVDSAQLVALRGSVSPMARPEYDRGAVNESTPAQRLLLVLNRPPEREAILQQLLKDLHTPGSPSYHHWLTPAEIGARFGPADSDLDAVKSWLNTSGFTVSRTSKARRFVEFSGTVGHVNAAFHTQIHEYMVDGVAYHANATPVQIPDAFESIIAGLTPLNDFRPTPQYQSAGQAHYDRAARNFQPELTLPPSWTPLLYAVAPADFYTEYDLSPLYSGGTNGAGKTIGIIDESNIDLGVVNAYRSVFGLPANAVQVVLDGGDPGQNSSFVETYLDVELAGAVAPAATINLYLSDGSPYYQDPLALAALRAVEDNQADVLSISWGEPEQMLATSGNEFWNALWEQAAAQGQTVVVSAGDYGQVPSEEYLFTGSLIGPAVNGLASTPWNIAAGGSDFYYSDYASGAPSASTLWNATNDPVTKGSLKARLPEQVWNDPFGLDAISNGLQRGEIAAGGGGASNCSTTITTAYTCVSGYSKPAWQSGPGVPADGVRDIPDVSLFASNGANFSGFAICDYEGSCTPDARGNFGVDIVGGTSASSPALAAILALVDQKNGRQGQANTVLYPLAQQKPAAFHDITLGGNWDICVQGDSDCNLNAGIGQGAGESTVYSATPGYDLASGLGSVDASQLVNNWGAISFAATSTTLQVTPAKAVHGSNVMVSANVAASSGSGTPTGAVSILTTSTLPSNASQTAMTLTGGTGSASIDSLPGGTYQLTAQYSGDQKYSSSTSAPQTLTITSEASILSLNIDAINSKQFGFSYGEPITFTAQPEGTSSSPAAATGTVAFTLDSATATIPVNVGGMASWISPASSVGTHTISASYSGDASLNPSSAKPVTFKVAAGVPNVNMNIIAPPLQTAPGFDVAPGGSITLTAQVAPEYGVLSGTTAPVGTLAPTGTVTICLTQNYNVGGNVCPSPTYSQTVSLTSPSGIYSQYSTATVTFPNLAAGSYMPEFQYNGDANWEPYGLFYITYIMVEPFTPLAATTTTLSSSTNSITQSQGAILTTTVAGSGSSAPTGIVVYYNNGSELTYAYLPTTTSGNTATVSFAIVPSELWNNGSNQITAVYYGDQNNEGSTSNVLTVTAAQSRIGDFSIAPQIPQITVQSGSTGSAGIALTSINGFNASIALTCTPSSNHFSCSVSPTSAALNGTGTATLTVTATLPGTTAQLAANPWRQKGTWTRASAVLAACLVLFLPWRKRRSLSLFCLLVLSALVVSCGGGSGGGSTTQPPPVNGTPTGTYTVLLTGTANGMVHTAQVTVRVD